MNLINGVKAYESNMTYTPIEDNIFNEIEKNKDKIESDIKQSENLSNKKDDNNLPDNPKIGSFISIALSIIDTISGEVFYFISKKKSELHRI